MWGGLYLGIVLLAPLPLAVAAVAFDSRPCGHDHPKRRSLRFLCLATSWIVIQICGVTALGLFGALTREAYLGFAVGLLALGLLAGRALVRSGTDLLGWARPAADAFRRASVEPATRVIVAALTAFVAIVLYRVATQPIVDFDSLWFHLPAIARWYQTGGFVFEDPSGSLLYDHSLAAYYPHAWHTLHMLFLLPFGEEFLAALPAWGAWLLLGASIYVGAAQLRAGRTMALAAAALVMSVPLVAHQVNTLHIDLPLAAVFATGMMLAVSCLQHGGRLELFLAICCMGLLIGIKTSGLMYAPFIAAVLVAAIVRHRADRGERAWVLGSAAAGVVTALFIFAPWYLRTYLATGSPIGVGVALFGVQVFEGPEDYGETSLLHRFDVFRLSHWLTWSTQAAVRLQLPVLVLVLAVLALAFSRRRLDPSRYLALAMLVATAVLYIATPYSAPAVDASGNLTPLVGYSIRYAFPFLAVLGVTGALGLTARGVVGHWVAAVTVASAFIGLASVSLFEGVIVARFVQPEGGSSGAAVIELLRTRPVEALARVWELLGVQLREILFYWSAMAVVVALAWRGPRVAELAKGLSARFGTATAARVAGALALALLVVLLPILNEARNERRTVVYGEAYARASELEPGAIVPYAASVQSFLFYGRRLDKQVVHVRLAEGALPQDVRSLSRLGVGPTIGQERRQQLRWLRSQLHSPQGTDGAERRAVLLDVASLAQPRPREVAAGSSDRTLE